MTDDQVVDFVNGCTIIIISLMEDVEAVNDQ